MAKSKKKDPRQSILDELTEATSKIDEDGLMFLLRQAQTLVYNSKVDELNEQRKKVTAALNPVAETKPLPEGEVYVESASFGKNFIFIIGNIRKTMSHEELKAMVSICLKSGEKEHVSNRLYRWIDRHRDDLLLDAGINNPADPRLKQMASYLSSNFRVSE